MTTRSYQIAAALGFGVLGMSASAMASPDDAQGGRDQLGARVPAASPPAAAAPLATTASTEPSAAREGDQAADVDAELPAELLRRHRRRGREGFAVSYGAAVLVGGLMAGGVALHARANPKDDVDFLLYGVSLPLLVPVAGPIYFGGLVGYVTTLSLATSSGSASGLALALAPLGYGLTIVSVVDGVLQAKFLGQAFASESPAASRASLGIRLSPIAIPAIPSPLAPVGSARGLPAALGIGVPVTF